MVRVRNEVPAEEEWNLSLLYPSMQDWENEYRVAQGEKKEPHWPAMMGYMGHLGDPHQLYQFLSDYFALDRKLSKLHTYAHLKFDEDLEKDVSKKNYGRITTLIYQFNMAFSWIEPELLSLSEDAFQTLLSNPELSEYRFYLEKIWRMRPHILSTSEEAIIASSAQALATAHKSFGALNNADLTFAPAINASNEKRELTTGTFQNFMRDPDRTLRKSAFENLHKSYLAHVNTLCELIQGQVESHFFIAKTRKFTTCRDAALFPNQIKSTVYDNLIEAIHENLDVLHDYIRLRKERLGVDALHPYDLYVPLVEEAECHYSYKEACQLVIDSVKPLGSEYTAALKQGLLQDRWVDPFENQKKRSGAYSDGCYDSMPYILMNYHGSLQDVLTLAHEAGHSMHSYYSRKNQSYVYSEYPIFVAEVASTFNEQLLLQHMKKIAKSKKEKAYLINYEIEGIRTTIFRQALFAEFEWQIHSLVEEGIPLTPDLLKEKYLALNALYYGPDLVLDGGIDVEWTRIPHFYYNFYVYQYATGLSAAFTLFDKVKKSIDSRDSYLQFISSGGSHYPIDLLRIAGVDLESKEPVQVAMKRFSELLQELKKVLSE